MNFNRATACLTIVLVLVTAASAINCYVGINGIQVNKNVPCGTGNDTCTVMLDPSNNPSVFFCSSHSELPPGHKLGCFEYQGVSGCMCNCDNCNANKAAAEKCNSAASTTRNTILTVTAALAPFLYHFYC